MVNRFSPCAPYSFKTLNFKSVINYIGNVRCEISLELMFSYICHGVVYLKVIKTVSR